MIVKIPEICSRLVLRCLPTTALPGTAIEIDSTSPLSVVVTR